MTPHTWRCPPFHDARTIATGCVDANAPPLDDTVTRNWGRVLFARESGHGVIQPPSDNQPRDSLFLQKKKNKNRTRLRSRLSPLPAPPLPHSDISSSQARSRSSRRGSSSSSSRTSRTRRTAVYTNTDVGLVSPGSELHKLMARVAMRPQTHSFVHSFDGVFA